MELQPDPEFLREVAKPMEIELFTELSQIALGTIFDKNYQLPTNTRNEPILPDTPYNKAYYAVFTACWDRFPRKKAVLTVHRFMRRLDAMIDAGNTGVLNEWRTEDENGNDIFHHATMFAAAVTPLLPGNKFDPDEYKKQIAEMYVNVVQLCPDLE
jgi:hypothetical protein